MLSVSLRDIKISLYDLGGICKVVSFIFLVPLALTLYYALVSGGLSVNNLLAFIAPAVILYLLFIIFSMVDIEDSPPKTKHAMITTSLAWLIIALVGSLPFIISGTLGPLDAFFESMSGWTTTGMTMIEQPELVARDILFYRALTQWVGGIGIIVLVLVVLMRKGTVARDYYSSEVGSLKLKPSIRSTVIETWKIYSIYTLTCIILLYIAGMTPFDAIAHSLTTLSTGGFSTHSESIAYFHSPLVELILVVFMLIGGINFILHLRIFEGKPSHLLENIESRTMLIVVLIATLICFYGLQDMGLGGIMTSLFQTVSIMTTTGYGTADISQWIGLSKTVLLVLMVIGGCYGSTGGGMKVLRVIVVIKSVFYAIKRTILPKTAVIRLKLDNKTIGYDEISYVLAFFTSYVLLIVMGTAIFTALNYEGYDSISITISAIGNVGPTYVTGDAWFNIPFIGKLTIIFLMWIGRLEILPVLILLSSIVYRRKRR